MHEVLAVLLNDDIKKMDVNVWTVPVARDKCDAIPTPILINR
jgi:hypothetical protein